MRRAIHLSLLCALAACGSGANDGYPALVPTSTLLGDATLSPDPAPGLEARAAALQARAAALRATSLSDGELPAN